MAGKTKLQIVIETKLGNSEKNLKKVEKGVDRVGAKAKKSNKEVGSFKKGLQSLSKKLKDNVGSLTAVVAGVVALGVAYFSLTEQVRKNKKQVEDLTGETGLSLDKLTVKVQTIADVFGDEFNEVIRAGNTLSKEFGITQTEALDLIEQGYIKGSNASGELLDMIKEYPTFMKSVKVSAEEMFVIMNKQVKDGVFSDKGIDSIKEADIKLKDFSKTTKQALDAVGLDSEKLQKQIESGALSRFQVIQKVSNKMQELGEDSAKTSALVREVFGGPGEDAGFKFLSTLGDISKEQEVYNGALTESQQLQADSLVATQKINKALLGLADNKAVVNAWNGVKLIFAEGLELLNKMLDFPSEFDKNIKKLQSLGIDTKQLQSAKQIQEAITANLEKREALLREIRRIEAVSVKADRQTSEERLKRESDLRKSILLQVKSIAELEKIRADENNKFIAILNKQSLINIELENTRIEISRSGGKLAKDKLINLEQEKEAVDKLVILQGLIFDDTVNVLIAKKELIEVNKNLETQDEKIGELTRDIESNTRQTVGLWDEAVNHLKKVQTELDNVNTKTKEIKPIKLIDTNTVREITFKTNRIETTESKDDTDSGSKDNARQIIIDRTKLMLESVNSLNEEFRLDEQSKAEIAFENGTILETDFMQMKIDFNNAELDAFESMLLNKQITQKDFDKKRRSAELINAKLSNDLMFSSGQQEQKIISDVEAMRFASMISQLDFTKNIGSQLIKLALRETVAKLIPSIISSVPFPFNIAAAATAPALAEGLFQTIQGFEDGGVVPGTSLTGDHVLARLNSQEEVLTRDDPRHILNQSFTSDGDTSKAINRLAKGLDAITDELVLSEKEINIEIAFDLTPTNVLEITEQGTRDESRIK